MVNASLYFGNVCNRVVVGSIPTGSIKKIIKLKGSNMQLLPTLTLDCAESKIRKLIEGESRFTSEFKDWLYATDYFKAPASSHGHNSIEGGLALHSFNVLQRLIEINNKMEFGIPVDSVLILGLFHDICKIHFYKSEKRNRKNPETKQWEEYDSFVIDDKMPLDHGHKSVILLRPLKLNMNEMLAIAWHSGCWDVSEYGRVMSLREAMKKTPWTIALQWADQIATFYDEEQ